LLAQKTDEYDKDVAKKAIRYAANKQWCKSDQY
jgi:hypothetical protein